MVRVKLISKEFTKSEDGKLIKMVGATVGSKAFARWGDEYTFTKESLEANAESWKYGAITLNHQQRDKGVIMESKFEDPNVIQSLQLDNPTTIEMMNTPAFMGFSQECEIMEAEETTSKDLLEKYKDNQWELSGQRKFNIKIFQGEGMSILFYPVTPACTKEMGCDIISSVPKLEIPISPTISTWSPWRQITGNTGQYIYSTSSDSNIITFIMSGTVPPNPSSKKADEGESWGAPSLSDFTNKYWADMSDGEKRNVAEHYAWTPKMPPEKFTDLKLPHHRAKDGAVVWRGVSAAMGALMGSRGGVDIPEADRQKVYSHLAAHYKQFDKEPPVFSSESNSSKSKEGENTMTEDLEKKLADASTQIASKDEENKKLQAQLADLQAKSAEMQTKSSETEQKLKIQTDELNKIYAQRKETLATEILSMTKKYKKEELLSKSEPELTFARDLAKESMSEAGIKFSLQSGNVQSSKIADIKPL